ncbi:class II aldolase/adducin family protein [Xanthobacter autotrophicus]|uniref:class II aldolase/adducin family protein n=1 Tax=Xanthobacter autotrophicus TaxID=280 RepID=UPI00372C0C5B
MSPLLPPSALVPNVRASEPEQAAERAAREDLAAAHRLAVWHGFDQGIYNHFTVAAPTRADAFLLAPFGLHWSEITAGGLLTVGYDGRLIAGAGEIQRSAYCIHAPIHRIFPQHAVVLHTHMPYASALTRLEDPQLQAIGQTEILLLDEIAYDNTYTGLAREPEEGERLATLLGPDKKILLLAHHGVIVTGRTTAEAYDRLFALERACQIQLYALWTGKPLKHVAPALVEKAQAQYKAGLLQSERRTATPGAKPHGAELHFAALRRLLDRREPDYRD